MRKSHLFLYVFLVMLYNFFPPACFALGTYRLNDTGTITGSPVAMKWKHFSKRITRDNEVQGVTTVFVNMNVLAWIGKNANIYLSLPAQSIGMVTINWTTKGTLLPGTLIAGTRTLIYSGTIQSSYLNDTLTLSILADGTKLTSMQNFEFHFEIDV